jgi:hypothetical protein
MAFGKMFRQYEEGRLLGSITAQETHYFSATVLGRLMLYKI